MPRDINKQITREAALARMMVKLPRSLLAALDTLVEKEGYASRMELIREALRLRVYGRNIVINNNGEKQS